MSDATAKNTEFMKPFKYQGNVVVDDALQATQYC